MTVLDVVDVSAALGDVSVLDSVSLSADAGEFVGLVGPNGAGKTTLLRTVNGVLAPDAGRVEIDGLDVTSISARERGRLVATVPQDTGVGFDLTVGDLVEMGRTPYRRRFGLSGSDDGERVRRALDRTAMADLRDRPVGAVSGGERQRAYVARALAQDTPVILCDEPTASLDVNHQVNVLSLLSDLAAEGRTVVAAIHDLDLAARFCDRLALLSGGTIRTAGAPETVLSADALDESFDAATTVTAHPVTGTPTVTAHRDRGEQSGRVHVLGGGPVGARVLSTLADAGYEVTAGPLADGDAARDAAAALASETVTRPPASLPRDAVRAAERLAGAADAVVLADLAFEDVRVLDVAAAAPAVVVEDRPLHERNYGDAAARRRYERLRDAGVTASAADLPEAVASVSATTTATAED